LELEITPYTICPCPGEDQSFTVVAKATGEGAEEAFVEIWGPWDQYASGTEGTATLEYSVTDKDIGTVLEFTASATDRVDVTVKGYVIQAVFSFMVFNSQPIPAFEAENGKPPNSWWLHLVEKDGPGQGFYLYCGFQVVPFVPQTNNPSTSYFATCPFGSFVEQYVKGYDAQQIVGNPVQEAPYQQPELVKKIEGTEKWDVKTQIQEFYVGDNPGIRINPPTPITQIAFMGKVGVANVYMIVNCKGECLQYPTIGKASWGLDMSVYPASGQPNPTGQFIPTNGQASTETPDYPP